MATWDDVRRIALGLPETSERLSRGLRQWSVRDRSFVWERPLRRADLEALGDDAPDGPILGAHVEHVGVPEVRPPHLGQPPTVERGHAAEDADHPAAPAGSSDAR